LDLLHGSFDVPAILVIAINADRVAPGTVHDCREVPKSCSMSGSLEKKEPKKRQNCISFFASSMDFASNTYIQFDPSFSHWFCLLSVYSLTMFSVITSSGLENRS